MGIRIVKDGISKDELLRIAEDQFGNYLKAVVDVDRRISAFGGDLHADEEASLIDDGSRQEYLWGINLYLDKPRDEWIEFDSMINVRPSHGNRSRGVESGEIREKIFAIINDLVGD